MDQRPSATSEERRSGQELIPPEQEQPQPKVTDIYISVWTEVDERPGRRVRSFVLSALFGLASAAAVLLFVALALITIPMVGVLSVVAMFAIIRHAQFRRVRTALARGKLRRT
jgi:Flp pilus assembly protein TadB